LRKMRVTQSYVSLLIFDHKQWIQNILTKDHFLVDNWTMFFIQMEMQREFHG
jgi:hypothetical protein